MRLHSEKNNVNRPHFFQRTGHRRARYKISLATFHLHAVLLHRAKMRAPREERHIKTCICHACANVSADGPGPRDQKFHAWSASAAATVRRRIFPVAVVGILFTR